MSELKKGQLELLVKRVLDGYIIGMITPPANKPMTPYRVSRLVSADLASSGGFEGIDFSVDITAEQGAKILSMALGSWQPEGEQKKISPGPVTGLLKRWQQVGFAVLAERPLAFSYYTEEATEIDLDDMKQLHRKELSARRRSVVVAD